MKSFEEQEKEERSDRRVRTWQRVIAPLVGLFFVALTWSVPFGLPYSTDVWQIVRILLCSPGVWLSSLVGRHLAYAVWLIEVMNFAFYAGASYLLMRWWSFRDDE